MSKRDRERQKRNSQIRTLAGLGLILAGIGLYVFLIGLRKDAASLPAAEALSVQPAAVHYPAPELQLQNINGRTEALADYRQNIVLVNNWATWCPPCKAEMPTLESYYEDHAPEGIMVIAVEAGGARDDVLPFVQKYGLKFQVWLDPKTASMAVFRNSNLPSSYVIDRTGTIRYAWTGEISRAMLEKFVTPLLKED